LKYFPILIVVTLIGGSPSNTKLSSQCENSFYISLLLDFIENHLVDVIFQKEISLLLEYF